ncbi:MAG: hypothetical protein ACTSQK_11160, partial [Candidatus Heimdallarchaeota archaeon]
MGRRTYYRCSFCSKTTRDFRARRCTYCGIHVCSEHRRNGLCPTHVNALSTEDADDLLDIDDFRHWFVRITVNLLFFLVLFSIIGISNEEYRKIGYILLGVFFVTL